MDCALKDISILVVEDDPDTRELLKVLLQSQGGEVTTAASVPEALSAYDNSRPNVIVADIGMPDYNGYALIGRVRARDDERGSAREVVVDPVVAVGPQCAVGTRRSHVVDDEEILHRAEEL